LSSIWGVKSASDAVVDVFAVVGGVGTRRVTCLKAEGVGSQEVGPFHDLNVRTAECVGEHDASHRVTTEISTMGVHLATIVTSHHVNLGLVHEAHGLDIIGRLQELDTSKCAGGDEASTVSGL
jgi:hypothetical protein